MDVYEIHETSRPDLHYKKEKSLFHLRYDRPPTILMEKRCPDPKENKQTCSTSDYLVG
jgi:hypothetical protein